MDHDQQFLSFIHKNAAMGVSAIPQVLSLPQSRAMGQALNSQLQEYRTIAAQSQAYARKHGARLHTPGLAVRAMSGAMLKARTAADHTTSKLAQLMIQGSTMGTVEMTGASTSTPARRTRSCWPWAAACCTPRNRTSSR